MVVSRILKSGHTATMKTPDSPQNFNARLAGWLFLIYTFVYLAFVLVNGFAPQLVDWKPICGINLAIWWGLGLIGLAFLLSFIYGVKCKHEVTSPDSAVRSSGSGDAFNEESAE